MTGIPCLPRSSRSLMTWVPSNGPSPPTCVCLRESCETLVCLTLFTLLLPSQIVFCPLRYLFIECLFDDFTPDNWAPPCLYLILYYVYGCFQIKEIKNTIIIQVLGLYRQRPGYILSGT